MGDKNQTTINVGEYIANRDMHFHREQRAGERKNNVKRILILSANPMDGERLHFDEEIRDIEEVMRR